MPTPIVSVDQLCTEAEAVLQENLEAVATALGFQRLGKVLTWQQLPVTDAISTAKLPAIAITSPGLVDDPSVSRASGTITTKWGLAIGVYARGSDHNDTQARIRDWCAAIRTTLLTFKSLNGTAKTLEWAAEGYELFPARENARTFGAGVISFDVTAEVPNGIDLTAGPVPVVTKTPTTVSVHR